MTTRRNQRWITLLLALLPLRVVAQNPDSLRVVQQIPFEKPGATAADPNGVLYVADARQNIVQVAPTGKVLLTYSQPTRGHLASLDAGFTGKVLAFYDDRQQLTLFDRFLSPISSLQLTDFPSTAAGLARAATLAPDGTIWLFDERDLSLLHLDPRDPGAATRAPLDMVLSGRSSDVRALRVYQNKLYLVDRISGVYVFDLFGAFNRKLPLPGLTDIQFSGDELFFLTPDGRALHYEALYSPTAAPRLTALPVPPVGTAWSRAVAGPADHVYLISAAGITLGERQP